MHPKAGLAPAFFVRAAPERRIRTCIGTTARYKEGKAATAAGSACMTAAILTEAAPTALWRDAVREAAQRADVALDEELESYLVFVLMRHLGDAELGARVLAIDYLEALLASGSQRAQALRDTGDRCLLIAGLFPEQAQRRRVSLGYFLDLGIAAYTAEAEHARTALAALYRHLAAAFATLVRALVELRRLSGDWQGLDALARHALGRADGRQEFRGAVLLDAPTRVQ